MASQISKYITQQEILSWVLFLVYIFFGPTPAATALAFRNWVDGIILRTTESSQRPALRSAPPGHIIPDACVSGCVHKISTTKIHKVVSNFRFPQWTAECDQHNAYAGSLLQVDGTASQMTINPLPIGPFRP